jgi:hypothetical protein
LASSSGLRYGTTVRYVSSVIRLVAADAAPRATNGSSVWCPPALSHAVPGAGCSVNAIPSKPAASTAAATSAIGPASSMLPAGPVRSG